jgi:hypothetical protein
MPDETFENFYKKIINGKKGNLFTRVDWLEDQFRKMRAGDTTNFITQVIQQNKEIIMPSVPGGTSDPTSAVFSGVIISPLGVLIPSDGVVYTFAVVVDGVVVSGVGDNGGTIITGGTGDVVGDTVPSVAGNIVTYSDATGKHIQDSGIQVNYLSYADPLYLTNTPSGISTYYTMSKLEPTATSPATKTVTINSADGQTELFCWVTPQLGTRHINKAIWDFLFWGMTSRVPASATTISLKMYKRISGGSESLVGTSSAVSLDMNGTGGAYFYNGLDFLNNNQAVSLSDRYVFKFYAQTAEVSDLDVTIKYGAYNFCSYVKIPGIEPVKSGLADGEFFGDTESGTAGAALSFGNLVYFNSSSKWVLVDADAEATTKGRLGICILAASGDGQPTTILVNGRVRSDAVFAMTVGVPQYAGTTAGAIQESAPSAAAGQIIRLIGHAVTAHELSFNPSNDYFEIG